MKVLTVTLTLEIKKARSSQFCYTSGSDIYDCIHKCFWGLIGRYSAQDHEYESKSVPALFFF